MAQWRKRIKSAGWRSFNIWLPADHAAALDELLAETDATTQNNAIPFLSVFGSRREPLRLLDSGKGELEAERGLRKSLA